MRYRRHDTQLAAASLTIETARGIVEPLRLSASEILAIKPVQQNIQRLDLTPDKRLRKQHARHVVCGPLHHKRLRLSLQRLY